MRFYQTVVGSEELRIYNDDAEELTLKLLRYNIINSLDEATNYLNDTDYQWETVSEAYYVKNEWIEGGVDVYTDDYETILNRNNMDMKTFSERMIHALGHIQTTDPEVLKFILSWETQLKIIMDKHYVHIPEKTLEKIKAPWWDDRIIAFDPDGKPMIPYSYYKIHENELINNSDT